MMPCFPAARYLGCRIKIEVRSNVNIVVIVEVVVEGFCAASFSEEKGSLFYGFPCAWQYIKILVTFVMYPFLTDCPSALSRGGCL